MSDKMAIGSEKIVFWGNGDRGLICLQYLLDRGFRFILGVIHPEKPGSGKVNPLKKLLEEKNIPVAAPCNPDDSEFEARLAGLSPDIFLLAGYGKILKSNVLKIPRRLSINLHGGKLPEMRGSSPMNWALIRGESSFTISVIQVDEGIDTGPVLAEKTFPVSSQSTIRDLHEIANREFPQLLVTVFEQLLAGTLTPRIQDHSKGRYFPLRFPQDGLIVWDLMTAQEVHNRIRALTEPYPCAFSFFKGRKVRLLSSKILENDFFGEPGRVYRKLPEGLLVCAKDKCLLIEKAAFDDNGEDVLRKVAMYDSFLSLRDLLLAQAQ